MAKRHIIQYYLEQQNLYQEMLENLGDFKELVEEGRITEDEYNSSVQEVEKLREYYEWLSYIIMLLNKPNRKDNKEAEITKYWYNALKGSSKEVLLDESRDALADFKEMVKNKKEEK